MDIEKIVTGIAAGVVSGMGTAYLAIRSWVSRMEQKLAVVDRLELDVAVLQQSMRNVNGRYEELEKRTEKRYDELRTDLKDCREALEEKLDRLIEGK